MILLVPLGFDACVACVYTRSPHVGAEYLAVVIWVLSQILSPSLCCASLKALPPLPTY